MSDLLFSEDQHLFKSGPIRVAELHAVVDEMMERTGVLKEQTSWGWAVPSSVKL